MFLRSPVAQRGKLERDDAVLVGQCEGLGLRDRSFQYRIATDRDRSVVQLEARDDDARRYWIRDVFRMKHGEAFHPTEVESSATAFVVSAGIERFVPEAIFHAVAMKSMGIIY